MYEVYIPLMGKIRTEKSWQKTISELKRARPDRVYIVYYRTLENAKAKKKAREVFKNNKDILENAGFKTGAWFCPTIGYGSPSPGDNAAEKHYRKIAGAAGGETHAFCPLDENFRKDLCDEFKGLAEMGTDTILLEDDFTLTGGKLWINNPGCLCDEHLRLLSERLGENVTRDKLLPYLITGKSNKYRKEYLKLMGETLLKIAEDIEKAVHSVSPDTRIGFSSNSASYHLEGASAFQIAETLAGKNKPFVRLTAAPYWKNGPSLNSTIENARMQGAWFTERGEDVMTEGDTYPRPRFLVSAAELEMYDIILRADGNSTGILKYMLDYNSLADYETGYVDFHAENAELYKEIENRFKGENVGLRVLEYPHNTGLMDFDDSFDYFGFADHGILPLISQWFVTDNSLPTTYGKTDGAALVFGTNAQLVTDEDLNQGLILDVKAAKILSEKGIDVGFLKIESAPKPAGEYFFAENDSTVASTEREGGYFKFTLKDNARVLSRFYLAGETLAVVPDYSEKLESFPACYLYGNAEGQRFMVYTFAPTYVKTKSEWHNGIFRNYYRQKQLINGYEWLCGKPLPAVCEKHPHLYILCKREGEKLHIGLFNLSKDKIKNPEVTADKVYKELDCFNCKGSINGRKIRLDTVLQPFSALFLTANMTYTRR